MMNLFRSAVVMAAVSAFVLSSVANAATTKGYISCKEVVVYDEAEEPLYPAGRTLLGKLPNNTIVSILQENSSQYLVSGGGIQGYVQTYCVTLGAPDAAATSMGATAQPAPGNKSANGENSSADHLIHRYFLLNGVLIVPHMSRAQVQSALKQIDATALSCKATNIPRVVECKSGVMVNGIATWLTFDFGDNELMYDIQTIPLQLGVQAQEWLRSKYGAPSRVNAGLRDIDPSGNSDALTWSMKDGCHEPGSSPKRGLCAIVSVRRTGGEVELMWEDYSDDANLPSPLVPSPMVAAPAEVPSSTTQASRGPMSLSRNVTEGLLIQKVQPIYPPEAKQARISGTVVLEAVIAKDGTIENLRALSGHPMLVRAAIDAVRQWRYKPYLVEGEPVEVDTQITVNFILAGG